MRIAWLFEEICFNYGEKICVGRNGVYVCMYKNFNNICSYSKQNGGEFVT